ncbi:MAG: redoxin domain-containing protein [Verrucomicrobiales bacterium]|nr:redoxin domain-containing protein [Verrucomicrobiales bacterium]
MKLVSLAVPALAGAVLCLASAAQLGEPAAPLKIRQWVKGDPVDLAAVKGRKIVVVEFWATWCPPCRTSIPHLTELQQKFKGKDVLFVGVSDEQASVVEPFVKKMGDQMDYAVAIDDDRGTSKGYMEAYEQRGIPTAFVVDKAGNVVWVGHPMAELEETLKLVVEGNYDLQRAKRRGEAMELVQRFFQGAQAGSVSDAELKEMAQRIEAFDRELGGLFPGQSFSAEEMLKQARAGRLLQRYQEAVTGGATPEELAAIEEEIRPQLPPEIDLAQVKRQMLASQRMQDYLMAAFQGEQEKADGLAKQTLEGLKGQAEQLNQLAWLLLTEEQIKYRDRKFALEAAKAAFDASKGADASIIDTYARALFDNGKTAEAIEYQKKAVAAAADESVRRQLEETLKDYQARAKP